MLKARYYLSMLSIILVEAAITTLFAVLSGHTSVLHQAVTANLAILGGVNLIGAIWLFRPVAAWLDGRGSAEACCRAVLRLPFRSTIWVAVVTLCYGLVVFTLGVFVPEGVAEQVPSHILPAMFAWFLLVYCTYLTFIAYFAVSDVAGRVRVELFRRDGLVTPGRGGNLMTRLVAVFAVVTVLPVATVLADLAWFQEVRRAQGLSVEKVVLLDLIGALIAVGLSLVFVTRGLVDPIDRLIGSVRRVQTGDLDAQVPVTTDDELGELTVSYNRMIDALRDRDFVRETFGKYVSPDVASRILSGRGQSAGRIRGQVGAATVMFTDIEGFSTVAATMNPAAVMDMLNSYLTLIAEPIQRRGGVINNFIGDALLATFNLPVEGDNHAADAVRCALEIQVILAQHRFAGGVRLDTRIGINTGLVVAGTVGPPDRLAYTVLGREVNLAARLEVLNKRYGSRVLVSGTTRTACGDLPGVAFRHIGAVDVKGETSPAEVYRVDDVAD